MKTKLVTYSLGLQLVISTASLIFVQKYETEIPLAIATPARRRRGSARSSSPADSGQGHRREGLR